MVTDCVITSFTLSMLYQRIPPTKLFSLLEIRLFFPRESSGGAWHSGERLSRDSVVQALARPYVRTWDKVQTSQLSWLPVGGGHQEEDMTTGRPESWPQANGGSAAPSLPLNVSSAYYSHSRDHFQGHSLESQVLLGPPGLYVCLYKLLRFLRADGEVYSSGDEPPI